jgi:hypothetical protein
MEATAQNFEKTAFYKHLRFLSPFQNFMLDILASKSLDPTPGPLVVTSSSPEQMKHSESQANILYKHGPNNYKDATP